MVKAARKAGGDAKRDSEGPARATRSRRWISSPGQLTDTRSGETLATREHEVIRHWAQARGAQPATVPGNEPRGRRSALRFQFPDFGGTRLEVVAWDEWLAAFDRHRLAFVFQERLKDGTQSNFFQLEDRDREEG